MHRRMLSTDRLLNKARRTARYKGYRRKRAFYIPERNDDMELTELLNKIKTLFNANDTKQLTDRLIDVSINNDFKYHKSFVDIVGDLKTDWLQMIYQYYEADREDKKQDYTPKTIGVLLCQLLGECSKVYDQCAGSGSLTIQYWSQHPDTEFICEELDENVMPYLLFNLSVRNIKGYVVRKDILADETYHCYKLTKGERFSMVSEIDRLDVDYSNISGCISNPPYNIKWQHPMFAAFDNRFAEYGVPPENNANYAFMLNALNKAERCAFILPNGVLSAGGPEQGIRKEMVNGNIIDTVITLPDRMFVSTSIPTCIVILDKKRKGNKVHMVDMRQQCAQEVREQKGQYGSNSHTNRVYKKEFNVFTPNNIKRCLDAIKAADPITEFYSHPSIKDIESLDYILMPSRYIDIAYKTIHRDIKDIVNDINNNVRDKNVTKITINESLAKGIDMYDIYELQERSNKMMREWNESVKHLGIAVDEEHFIRVSKNKNEIKIEQQDKEIASELIMQIINSWKAHIMYLNNKQNILLAELRDVLLEKLMSGEIEV